MYFQKYRESQTRVKKSRSGGKTGAVTTLPLIRMWLSLNGMWSNQ